LACGIILLAGLPLPSQAQPKADKFFQAKVLEVLEEKKVELNNGSTQVQQNLKLKGLEGEYQGQEITFEGIGSVSLVAGNVYTAGDKVLVAATRGADGQVSFYVTDYARSNVIWWLAGIFGLAVLITGRLKGLRALLALGITFLVLVYYILPRIAMGEDPVVTTLVGGFFVLLAIIYTTEGWRPRSHLAVGSVFLSMVFVLVLSWVFMELAKLTGVSGEETGLLTGMFDGQVPFRGLLLAGIIIGSLGVLDDVAVSQVAATEEIHAADKYLAGPELFRRSYRVGVSHLASMVNTLFLAYAGASLPLLLMFVGGHTPFSTVSQVLSNEAIATEIIRTLAGSLGIILSVPLATAISVWYYKIK